MCSNKLRYSQYELWKHNCTVFYAWENEISKMSEAFISLISNANSEGMRTVVVVEFLNVEELRRYWDDTSNDSDEEEEYDDGTFEAKISGRRLGAYGVESGLLCNLCSLFGWVCGRSWGSEWRKTKLLK